MSVRRPAGRAAAPRPRLEALGDVDLDALALGAHEDLLEHDVRDLLHLRLGQLAEDDDLVQPVQELGPEVLLQLLVHLAARGARRRRQGRSPT